jgi:hypothetical protein
MSDKKSPNYGKPWKTAGSFDSFEAADLKRNNLQENGNNLQAKVRWRSSQNAYAVLYRELAKDKPKEKKKAPGKKRARKKQQK